MYTTLLLKGRVNGFSMFTAMLIPCHSSALLWPFCSGLRKIRAHNERGEMHLIWSRPFWISRILIIQAWVILFEGLQCLTRSIPLGVPQPAGLPWVVSVCLDQTWIKRDSPPWVIDWKGNHKQTSVFEGNEWTFINPPPTAYFPLKRHLCLLLFRPLNLPPSLPETQQILSEQIN